MENINSNLSSPSFGSLKIKKGAINGSKNILETFLKEETAKVEKWKAVTGDKTLKTPQELLGEIQARQINNPYNIVLYPGTSRLGYGDAAKIAIENPEGRTMVSNDLNSVILNTALSGQPPKPVSLFNETLEVYENMANKLNS